MRECSTFPRKSSGRQRILSGLFRINYFHTLCGGIFPCQGSTVNPPSLERVRTVGNFSLCFHSPSVVSEPDNSPVFIDVQREAMDSVCFWHPKTWRISCYIARIWLEVLFDIDDKFGDSGQHIRVPDAFTVSVPQQ